MLDLGSTLTIASPGSLTAAGFARSDARIKLTDTVIGGATGCNHMPTFTCMHMDMDMDMDIHMHMHMQLCICM